MRKQAKGKAINKHMRNGGMYSFNFHPSPRMVPHVFRPEAQFREMSIEKFVPRGKTAKDYNDPVPAPAYKNKLTDAESDLLAKYFASSGEISWRPSLIAFPHFQAFPSPVDKVVHSSRTGMLIDAMQYLQGLTFPKDSKTLSAEDEDILDPSFRVEAVEPHDIIIEERSTDPTEEELKKEIKTDTAVEKTAKDMQIEDVHRHKPSVHTPLFGSEFVSVDDVGNVVVLSLPKLPHDLMHDSENHEEIIVQSEDNNPSCPKLPEENLLEFSPCNLKGQKGKWSNENDMSDDDRNLVHDIKLPSGDETGNDFRDSELSPRLTNFIESGIVPESPVNYSGTCKHDEKTLQDACTSNHVHDMQTHVPHRNNNAPTACTSPTPVAKETQSPFAKPSNTSGSEDWLLDSGINPETVERQCKLRRLRKLGDLDRKEDPSEPREQTGPRKKLKTSKGKKKRARDVAVYIEEEAEVSSEGIASDNEEDEEHDNSSYEDSFIDDGVNPTSVSTQAGVGRTDMMAIYRRSLLSQSPFQRLPAKSSPADSVVQSSSRMDESGSSSGPKHDDTPQTGLQSTARISQYPCDGKESTLKRKLSYYQAQSIPMVNLDKEFSVLSETAGENENSSSKIQQVEKTEQNIDIFEDDQFFEGIDLDAVEEEATKLLRYKTGTECLTSKNTMLSEPVQQIFGVMGSPSFDLGI